MKKLHLDPLAWVAALFALACLLILTGCQSASIAQVGSTLKVILKEGHGSAVHIGNGYVITAAHVAGDNETVKLQFDDRSVAAADVLWSNKAKDVALLRFKASPRVGSSPIACRLPEPGEHVTARGSPLWMEYLTFEGRVSGAPVSVAGMVDLVPADLTVIAGMSGGGIFDDRGNVIGITSAHAVVPMGFTTSWTRVGLFVSGKTICDLMGRGI